MLSWFEHEKTFITLGPADSKNIFYVLMMGTAECKSCLVSHCKKFLLVLTGSTFLIYLVQAVAFVPVSFDTLGHPLERWLTFNYFLWALFVYTFNRAILKQATVYLENLTHGPS